MIITNIIFIIEIFLHLCYILNWKVLKKNRCAFCNRDNHFSNKCLKVTYLKARKRVIQRHLVKNLTYVKICTFINNSSLLPPKKTVDGTNQSDGTLPTANNFSNSKKNVALQTASMSVGGFDNKRKVNNAQLLLDRGQI